MRQCDSLRRRDARKPTGSSVSTIIATTGIETGIRSMGARAGDTTDRESHDFRYRGNTDAV